MDREMATVKLPSFRPSRVLADLEEFGLFECEIGAG